ncbi:type II secretion system F family protein [Salinisphaera aquimarina]|uniref:Type II secretion system F family protein n=1 Tax=Salinisphaera aquimarina TaxID=2094031 RepID=A0ABV7EW49_9GAMM
MWIGLVVLAVLTLAVALLVLASASRHAQNEALIERVGDRPALASDELHAQGHDPGHIRNPLVRWVCRRCWSAGIDARPERVNLYLLAGVIAGPLMIVLLGGVGVLVVAVMVIFPSLFVAQRGRARRRRINAQLPNFLGYLVRALTAGNTLEEGVHSAALESAEPIRSVFLSVSRQVRLGASIEDTLTEAAMVHELRALHILAMSARVNRRYGGSMRRVIASLIETIRQQEAASRELKALTGETRFSAYVVAAIPIAISAFFYLQNPQYYAVMLQSSGGRIAIVLALVLEALGLFIIWRMMSRLQEPDA